MSDKEVLLERFLLDENLKGLENDFSKFNIFDCLKLTRAEIRHSNFLAWLLDPNETHGLNDFFLKEFLKKILKNNENVISTINNENSTKKYNTPNILDIDKWNMAQADVFREYENIDLLIVDKKNKFVFVIENKIDSFQHSGQLTKYRKIIDKQYGDFDYNLFVYLKPEKLEDIEKPYIYVNYNLVKEVLDDLLFEKQNTINPEVEIAIKHYKTIIERDIMTNDELRNKCAQIYRKHSEAIDLINKYGMPQKALCDILKEVLEQKDYVSRVYCESNSVILALPSELSKEQIEKMQIAEWKPDNCCVNIKFSILQWGSTNVTIEILFGPLKQNCDSKLISDLKQKLNKLSFTEKDGWAWSEHPALISLNQYLKYDKREDVVKHISDELDKVKGKFIDYLANAVKETIK